MRTKYLCASLAAAGLLAAGSASDETPSHPEESLRVVSWRLFVSPPLAEIPGQLVDDSQALLIRAAVLRQANGDKGDAGAAATAGNARDDFDRIAAARPVDQYVPSQALARADLGLSWMRSQPGDDATTRRLALYLVALAAIARETEEREINPGGIVLRYWDNTFHSSLARSKPDWRPDQRVKEYDPQDEPPEGTCLAREMVTNDLQLLASASKLSAADIDSLIAAFADQSLGGIKYLEEFRDAIAGAPGRP